MVDRRECDGAFVAHSHPAVNQLADPALHSPAISETAGGMTKSVDRGRPEAPQRQYDSEGERSGARLDARLAANPENVLVKVTDPNVWPQASDFELGYHQQPVESGWCQPIRRRRGCFLKWSLDGRDAALASGVEPGGEHRDRLWLHTFQPQAIASGRRPWNLLARTARLRY
jgi:hypothetical protein